MTSESNGGQDYGILTHRFMSAGQWDRSLATAMDWLSREPENLSAHRVAAQSLVNLERTGGKPESIWKRFWRAIRLMILRIG